LVHFDGQVFGLLLERDGGDLFVLVVLLSRLVSILVEIYVLMMFRCGRHRSGLFLAPPCHHRAGGQNLFVHHKKSIYWIPILILTKISASQE
jgi:hypothetical protein